MIVSYGRSKSKKNTLKREWRSFSSTFLRKIATSTTYDPSAPNIRIA
jgi:hypothetical protein